MTKMDENDLVFFKNYDYANTPEKGGPGKGLYNGEMDKYKSVGDFLKKKKQRNRKRRKMALLLAITFPKFAKDKTFKSEEGDDENDIQDPYEEQGMELNLPVSPAEVSMLGMYDGITQKDDLDGKPMSNLYYGVLETHEFA